jgi:hypothetical protein
VLSSRERPLLERLPAPDRGVAHERRRRPARSHPHLRRSPQSCSTPWRKDGAYVTVRSSGWEPEAIATQSALDEIERQKMDAWHRARAGTTSPLEYYMYCRRMDLALLAQTTGFSRWRIRRHFKPAVHRASPIASSRATAKLSASMPPRCASCGAALILAEPFRHRQVGSLRKRRHGVADDSRRAAHVRAHGVRSRRDSQFRADSVRQAVRPAVDRLPHAAGLHHPGRAQASRA